MWITLGSAITAIGSAIILGMISFFIGIPIHRFRYLRGEVIRRLAEFANVRARWIEVRDASGAFSAGREAVAGNFSETDIKRLEEAQRTFRDLGSQMHAFAQNERVATWLLMWLRYSPQRASDGLIGLANDYDTYGNTKAFQRKTIQTALRLKP